jgi:hypothetical protein
LVELLGAPEVLLRLFSRRQLQHQRAVPWVRRQRRFQQPRRFSAAFPPLLLRQERVVTHPERFRRVQRKGGGVLALGLLPPIAPLEKRSIPGPVPREGASLLP